MFYKGGPFDHTNARALINICPEEVRSVLLEKMSLDLLYMNEEELTQVIHPDASLNRLRLAFWKEYETAQSQVRHMTLSNVAIQLGFTSANVARTLKTPKLLAWVLCPPASYENFLEESLMAGMRKLREIIGLDIIKDGEVDHKTAELILKATAFIDMRKNGGIVQKNLTVNLTKETQRKVMSTATLEELDLKIAELENRGLEQDVNELEVSYARSTES